MTFLICGIIGDPDVAAVAAVLPVTLGEPGPLGCDGGKGSELCCCSVIYSFSFFKAQKLCVDVYVYI